MQMKRSLLKVLNYTLADNFHILLVVCLHKLFRIYSSNQKRSVIKVTYHRFKFIKIKREKIIEPTYFRKADFFFSVFVVRLLNHKL